MDLVSYFGQANTTDPLRVLISLPCMRQIKMVKIFQLISEFMTNLKAKPRMITLWIC